MFTYFCYHYLFLLCFKCCRLTESCALLNLSKGSALLLRETLQALEGATGVEDIRGKALAEIGVNNFTPKMALNILNRRIDITVNRMIID